MIGQVEIPVMLSLKGDNTYMPVRVYEALGKVDAVACCFDPIRGNIFLCVNFSTIMSGIEA